MGDLFDWSTESNGGAIVEERSTASSSSSSLCSNNVVIRAEFLEKAEEVTRGIIDRIQPNSASEERRAAVIDYVQRLIRNCLGCGVFPFGSVPLKTYLPDGDIDLTTFGGMNAAETFAHDVFAVLEGEDQNEDAEFLVKDVQLICAEVKLIKCIIQNIVVDISFNQIEGLCTLCFLEQIDQLIGKDHLFKRSIILVKAWCYYESRILGAHHGLISTYALETLVLYIFHLFHSTLDAPLSVLHKFLDYYSKFDWDKYCVSLSGPVLISYLPEVVIDPPEIGSGELLLSKDFLKECVDKFSVPSKGYRIDGQNFTPKHLNIVDPLKENNNLGRSVSKGSFFRIRSAFSFGVRKLEKVLCDVEMDIANELRVIFSNTLDRHGSGPRPDIQDIASEYDNLKLSDEEIALRFSLKEEQPRSEQVVPSVSFSRPDSLRNSVSLADQYPDEVNGIVSRSSMVSNVSSNCLPSKNRTSSCQMGKVHHSPYCFSSHSLAENGERCNGFVDVKHVESYVDSEPTNSGSLTVVKEGCPRENNVMGSSETSNSKTIRNSHLISSPRAWSFEDNQFGCSGGVWDSQAGGISNTLADLTGDFENHLRSLDYCRWCHEYALMAQISHTVPLFLPQSQVKKSWDVLRRSFQNKRSVFTKRNHDGTPTRSTRCSFSAPSVSGAPCTVEEMIKPRGTGTYFSNMNHYRNRNLAGRGRNHVAVRSLRSNGHLNTSSEMDFVARNSELLQPHFVCLTSDLHSFGSLRSTNSDAKRSPHLSENALEFSPSGQSFWATSNNVANDCSARNSIILSSPVKDLNQDRGTVHSYRLKDEGDFPPLS